MWIYSILILMASINRTYAANPYQLGEVDYFSHKEQIKEAFDWHEPAMTSDGQLEVYTPPKMVLNLLENPTDTNARAYLAWQRQKVEKIIKAQQAIENVLQEEEKL